MICVSAPPVSQDRSFQRCCSILKDIKFKINLRISLSEAALKCVPSIWMAKLSSLHKDNEGVVFLWVPGDTSNITIIPPSASHLPQLRN